MASVSAKALCELTLESTDFVTTAVILSRTDPNVFQAKDSPEYRSVIQFTIRDSKQHITNCKCWGSKDKIEIYYRTFNLYDIIDIVCPRVVLIRDMQQEQQFQPITTLSYQLVINERTGFLEKHNGQIKDFQLLCRSSIRPLSNTLNLADINSTNVNFRGHYVDLLVAVALLKPIKDVKAKSGYPLKCLELVVIDKSLPGGMMLTIWNTAWIERSLLHWKPLKTILHLIDARVGYSEFYKTTTLGMSSRSLLFENPIGFEVEQLDCFLASGISIDTDLFSKTIRDFLPDPQSITTLMTVQQIYDRINAIFTEEADEFTAVVLATVTKFELDRPTNIISRKCKSCSHRMNHDQDVCGNGQCQMSFSFNGDKFDKYFDINLHLSDHTGTLIESRLIGLPAEQTLRLSVDEFIQSSEKQKEDLKWHTLLKRHEVKVYVKKPTPIFPSLVVRVVAMRKVDVKELSNRIIVY